MNLHEKQNILLVSSAYYHIFDTVLLFNVFKVAIRELDRANNIFESSFLFFWRIKSAKSQKKKKKKQNSDVRACPKYCRNVET